MKIASTTASPASFSPRTLRRTNAIPERHRRQRVTEVVDQVGQQRDRVREQKDEQLPDCGKAEDKQAERDRLDALPRADDRAIDETVRVAMTAVAVAVVRIAVEVLVIVMPVRVLMIVVGMIVLRRSSYRAAGTWLLAAHRRLRVAFEVCVGRAARASCAAR
jgi:hypothetical protein